MSSSNRWSGEGAVVPLVTPFDADGLVDEGALRRLVRWQLERGSEALMPTALSGEGLLLEEGETLRVWEIVCDELEGRPASFLPAVIALTTRRAQRLARRADELGAAAMLSAPVLPELYSGRATDELVAFYRELAEVGSTPLILFDYPAILGVDLEPRVLERLVAVDRVLFLKTSNPDAGRLAEQVRAFGDRLGILCGAPGSVLTCLSLGCRGWITGLLNVIPDVGRELLDAFAAGDLGRARKAFFDTIMPLADLIHATRKPLGVLKTGLSMRGVPVGGPRAPGLPLEDESGLRRILAGVADED